MTAGETFAVESWRAGSGTGTWRGVAAVLLVLGLAAFVVHPALGLGVMALLVAPLFVVAPKYALLLFVALLPFDAVSAIEDDGASLTWLLGIGLMGGWALHVLVERKPIRMTRPAMAL